MQQAFNENERNQREPASITMRVVHSPRTTEKQETVARKKETDQQTTALPPTHYGSTTHYGRSYYPDGPAGNYWGL